GDDGLHRALAERARPDQRRPLVIVQRAGNDFGRGRRSAIDENHQRLALDQVTATRAETLGLLGEPAPRRDDLAARHESARHRYGLVEQPAWIVAEVDDVAHQLLRRNLL